MESQSYERHAQMVPGYHYFLTALLLATLIGACVNLYHSLGDHQRLYSASLLVTLTIAVIFAALYGRVFALKAQDRAIRAEENLRHYALTGKLLDPRLTVQQIIGLRFASDAEFPALARQAAERAMSLDEIKREVKTWRADTYRV